MMPELRGSKSLAADTVVFGEWVGNKPELGDLLIALVPQGTYWWRVTDAENIPPCPGDPWTLLSSQGDQVQPRAYCVRGEAGAL